MRNLEERVTAVQRRVAEMERQKKLRRAKTGVACAVAACLGLIIGASWMVSGLVSQITVVGDYSDVDTAASMFSRMAFGYAVIALLAFVLGVCVTILCYRLRVFHREDPAARSSRGEPDDGGTD